MLRADKHAPAHGLHLRCKALQKSFNRRTRNTQCDYSRSAHGRKLENSEFTRGTSLPQALFENLASWNGHGLSLYGWTCGTRVAEYAPERAVSLMIRAAGLNTSPKLFSREPEQLDLRDMYIYDMIVCMNEEVRCQVLEHFEPDLQNDWDCVEDRDFYRQRVCTLHDFLRYVPDEKFQQQGGSALLPKELSRIVDTELTQLKTVTDIPNAELSKVQEWNNMLKCIVVGVAGVTQYLIDSYPKNLDRPWLR